MRSPYRSCVATLKGWTLLSTDGRPRVKQGNASRKLGGREKPQKGVRSPEGRGSRVRGEAERSGKG